MDLHRAGELLREHCANERIRAHCLASSVVLAALARRLGHDPELWAVAGLLHDLDYDQTAEQMHRHCLVTAEVLQAEGAPE